MDSVVKNEAGISKNWLFCLRRERKFRPGQLLEGLEEWESSAIYEEVIKEY